MGIFSRIGDIINANILNMVERAEDPEKMIRLMIQEMEDTLVEVKTSAARMIAEKKGVERQIAVLHDEQRRWQDKAELAVSKNRDDLAMQALEEKAKKASSAGVLSQDLAVLEQNIDKSRSDIERLQAKLDDARSRQKILIMRHRAALSQKRVSTQLANAESPRTLARFENVERQIDRLEGETTAMNGFGNSPLDKEFEKLEHQSAVAQELAAMKARMGLSGDTTGNPRRTDVEPQSASEAGLSLGERAPGQPGMPDPGANIKDEEQH